ncbi:glycoside hydrolase/deacetylase [Basidiobolus meristosporus CBS 931.73]|uniref:Glycoside hydrolase/deacetylase n=1 Tax=Basidiobolus meristosporus CBS 931.73 TaxID=1314790 RepID=A0A1Y1X2Q6_9FUNG|nr:glycoside hydrolase/deacetylase [Basidiobolus meristosporus CBS 931.73]|eukprot:ORX80090.1 glycoside hydrolase/deacetylase [Basidiobolus meristosporus CBS 931.73]
MMVMSLAFNAFTTLILTRGNGKFRLGPGESTEDLLRILKEKQVKATLFVLGSQVAEDGMARLLKQAYNDGHQIASHTYDHIDLNRLSSEKIKQQMLNTEAEIKKVIGVVPAMMRPPYGNCSETCTKVMKDLGYSVIQWNVDSDDWTYMGKPKEYDELVDNILSKVYRSNPTKDSWISLQHDIHKFSVERTPKIVDRIKAKGYKFVTVNECLKCTIELDQLSQPYPNFDNHFPVWLRLYQPFIQQN